MATSFPLIMIPTDRISAGPDRGDGRTGKRSCFDLGSGVNEIEHPIRSVRVKSDRGFIKEDELWFFDQNLRNPQALSHPFRIRPDFLLRLIQKGHQIEGLIDSGIRNLVRYAV